MFHVGGVMTDGKIAPWDRDVASKEVRCAIIQGTDRELLNEVIQNGFTEVANGLFSPGQEGYLDDNGLLPYDPRGRCGRDRGVRGGERTGHGEVHDHGHGHHEGAPPTSSSRSGRASASTSTRPRSSSRR